MPVTDSTLVDSSFHELLAHGTQAFPLEVEQINLMGQPARSVGWHWHEDFQFFLMTEGEAEFFVNKSHYALAAGEGLFVNSGVLHSSRAQEGSDASAYLCIDISPTLLSLYPGSVFETRYVRPYLGTMFFEGLKLTPQSSWQREILEGVSEISRLFETRGFGSEYRILSLVSRMWIAVAAHAVKEEGTLREHLQAQVVCRMISYIAGHYRKKVTLEALAQAVHKSPSECCRLFKAVTQTTIFRHLENYRIEKAVNLLKSTSLSVEAIASEVGFQTTSYFIRVFSRRLGKTPLVFRKTECRAGTAPLK